MRFLSSMLGLWLGQVLGDALFILLGKPFDATMMRDRLALLAVASLAARLVAVLADGWESLDWRGLRERISGRTPKRNV